jgi:hypothetical protein
MYKLIELIRASWFDFMKIYNKNYIETNDKFFAAFYQPDDMVENIEERNTEDYLTYVKDQIDFIYDNGFDIEVRPTYITLGPLGIFMKESDTIRHNLVNMVIYRDQSIDSISKYLAEKILLIERLLYLEKKDLEKKDKLPTDSIISYLESKSFGAGVN